nr:MAG TPA: hypothetical protein [Bacteriophage sp.]
MSNSTDKFLSASSIYLIRSLYCSESINPSSKADST